MSCNCYFFVKRCFGQRSNLKLFDGYSGYRDTLTLNLNWKLFYGLYSNLIVLYIKKSCYQSFFYISCFFRTSNYEIILAIYFISPIPNLPNSSSSRSQQNVGFSGRRLRRVAQIRQNPATKLRGSAFNSGCHYQRGFFGPYWRSENELPAGSFVPTVLERYKTWFQGCPNYD